MARGWHPWGSKPKVSLLAKPLDFNTMHALLHLFQGQRSKNSFVHPCGGMKGRWKSGKQKRHSKNNVRPAIAVLKKKNTSDLFCSCQIKSNSFISFAETVYLEFQPVAFAALDMLAKCVQGSWSQLPPNWKGINRENNISDEKNSKMREKWSVLRNSIGLKKTGPKTTSRLCDRDNKTVVFFLVMNSRQFCIWSLQMYWGQIGTNTFPIDLHDRQLKISRKVWQKCLKCAEWNNVQQYLPPPQSKFEGPP